MRIVYRTLSVIGALTLGLLTYSAIRSPGGTGAMLLFITSWWIEPLRSQAHGNDQNYSDIIKNPHVTEVGGIPLSLRFKLTYEDVETVAFNGDGHAILVAQLDSEGGSIEELARQHGLRLSKLEPGILTEIQFLKDTTPYEKIADQIAPLLEDPQATYFLLGLKRNGVDISDMDIYIFSPATGKALQWSSHF